MSLSALIIFFASLLILGVISIVVKLCKINRDRKDVQLFVDKVAELKKCESSRTDPTECITFILATYQEVSTTIREEGNKMPVYTLGTDLSFQRPIEHSLYGQIAAEEVEFIGTTTREKKRLKCQLCNPFILLYRGVELIMDIVFGYIIRKINPEFNPDDSSLWKSIIGIVSFIGSVVTIISYIQTH